MRPDDDYANLRRTLQRIAPLPDEEFQYLRQQAEPRSYSAGQALIEIGGPPSRCWFLISGFLRFFYVTESGREYNKAFSRPGEIVMPLSAALAGTPNSFVIAAVTDAKTWLSRLRSSPCCTTGIAPGSASDVCSPNRWPFAKKRANESCCSIRLWSAFNASPKVIQSSSTGYHNGRSPPTSA